MAIACGSRSQSRAREHVSPRGNDVRAGAVVLRAGEVLTPARLGVAASFGLRSLVVRRKPVVARDLER